MVEVGIPVYKARDTLPQALDSLVTQTRKMFIVCLSIDDNKENYDDIIETYQKRGLNIRTVRGPNAGAGIARQRILDSTECEFIMFLDADDMLMPPAVEALYSAIKKSGADVLRSAFVRENSHQQDVYLPQNFGSVTWFHGKIYKVSYLKENNIRFLPSLRVEEDVYFNLIAWNCTKKRAEIKDVTYYWRDNQNSVTRLGRETDQYFKTTYLSYIQSQVEALRAIFKLNPEIDDVLITYTLNNIYNHYMKARFYHLDEKNMDSIIGTLKSIPRMQDFFKKGENWVKILQTVKPGIIINTKEQQSVVFYKETFEAWASRILMIKNG